MDDLSDKHWSRLSHCPFHKPGKHPPAMTDPQFMDKVTNNLIVQGAVIHLKSGSETRTIEGRYYKTDPMGKVVNDANGKKLEVPFRAALQISDRELEKVLATGEFRTSER
jgi:hypothetical protein